MSNMRIQDVEKAAQTIGDIPANDTAKVAKTGPVGGGKSSGIESLASALTGGVEKPAGAGQAASSLTENCTVHELQFRANPGNDQAVFRPVQVSVVWNIWGVLPAAELDYR